MKNILSVIFLLISFNHALAQSSDEPSKADPTPAPPLETIPAESGGSAMPAPEPTPTPIPLPNAVLPPDPKNNYILFASIGALILAALGFFGLQFKKGKVLDEKKDKKCLNFKKMMEDKLNELTDLKGKLKDKVKDEVLKQLPAEIEIAHKEYERFKKLYEECIIEFSLPKTTLLYLYKPNERQILLAMKKRSFGKGKLNGVGGKLNDGETIEEALIREAKEEIGVDLKESDLKEVAKLKFNFKDQKEWDQVSHVFFAEKWEGEPAETEEMSPEWYHVDSLPYDRMWIDDIHWLPQVIAGKKIKADFVFDKTGEQLLDKKVNEN